MSEKLDHESLAKEALTLYAVYWTEAACGPAVLGARAHLLAAADMYAEASRYERPRLLAIESKVRDAEIQLAEYLRAS